MNEIMEFNVLPRTKFLSPRISHKSSQTTSQTVNVILPQTPKPVATATREVPANESDAGDAQQQFTPRPPEVNPYAELDPGTVCYDQQQQDQSEQIKPEESIATINFLKLILESYMNNPIKYNGFIICSVPLLEKLIETLTNCEDCSVDVEDADVGCCGVVNNKIVPVSKIWVLVNGNNEVFKYKYSQYLQIFEEYRISLKYVYTE